MSVLAAILIAVTALLHAWFLVLEMFLWQRPRGMRTFRTTPEVAKITATLAANQGLYNGFLAAGLVWGLFAPDPIGFQVRVFFLGCVIVAGLYGAATVQRGILYVQALPGALALAAVLMSRL
jgi:putative membrane protein